MKFDNFTIKDKHLTTNSTGYNKFNVGTPDEAMSIVKKYAKENNLVEVVDNGIGSNGQQSYKAIFDTGTTIGTKGETRLIVIYDELGNVWTTYPYK